MSSKTLAVTVEAGRITGAVIESSIGSFQVGSLFQIDTRGAEHPRLPVAGPFDRVIATLPCEMAVFRVLDLPFRDRRRLTQAVGPALEEHVPISLDDGVLAWDVTSSEPSATGGQTVLAALADSARIAEYEALLASFGAEPTPQRLLWQATAVLAAYRRAVGQSATFTAIDVGDGGAVIAEVDGGRIAQVRIVAPCDDELLIRNTAWSVASLGVTSGRAVVGGRHGERLLSQLSLRLDGLRIEALPPAAPVDGFADRDWRESTALAGLILAASGEAPAPMIDFERGAASLLGIGGLRDLADLRDEARPLVRWASAAAILAVLSVGIDYFQLFSERRTLAARAEQIYTTAMPSGSGGAGRKLKLEMRLREMMGRSDAGTGGAGSPLALLATLSRDVPNKLDVVFDQVEHQPPSAKVAGHAASFETVTKMQEALQKGGSFSRVEVKDVHAAVSGSGVEFLLEPRDDAFRSGHVNAPFSKGAFARRSEESA